MTVLATRIAAIGLSDDHILARAPDEVLTVRKAVQSTLRATSLSPHGDLGATIVATSIKSPLGLVRTLLALDGRVRGILMLAPTLPSEALSTLMADVAATALVSDRADLEGAIAPEAIATEDGSAGRREASIAATTWFMTTSGTTGIPKVVHHTLESLSRSIRMPRPDGRAPVWGLLYEPSRFAGLQVVLQALLGGGTLVAPEPDAAWSQRLAFLKECGCTHLSATPTLWRKLLMSSEADGQSLRQITLGGEIADASVLKALAAKYPQARITHIYASTEVGVGFSVNDGLPGFPVRFLEEPPPTGAALKIVDDMLWVRPPGAPLDQAVASHIVHDAEGYVRTSDRVTVDGDRVTFLGRESTTVNIGGAKIQLEDVEKVVNEHPGVAACSVAAQANPIVGALLALTVVPHERPANLTVFRGEIKLWCKTHLPREAQPVSITVAESIPLTAAGKISRVKAL